MNEDPRRAGSGPIGPEPGLFDLPLDAPSSSPSTAAASEEPAGPGPRDEAAPIGPELAPEPAAARAGSGRRGARGASRPETLPLFDFEPSREGARAAERTEPERARFPPLRSAPARSAMPSQATAPTAQIAPRLRGTGGDLVIVAAIGALAALGAGWLGAPVGVDEIVPLALFLLAWSFVYFVVPLAFWGQTPGMSWAGLVARANATEPLSFGQAALRWLGTWLTWATLGLAGLLALTGRSLADRISGSSTFPESAAAR